MEKDYISKQLSILIKESSPLYEYWESPQKEQDEKNRLSKLNNDEIYKPGLILYREEPYKWEILYQSIIRASILNKIKPTTALKKMIFTLNSRYRSKLINSLKKNAILPKEILDDLNDTSLEDFTKLIQENKHDVFNLTRFIGILFAIFANPFDVKIKTKKIRIYEKIGSSIYNFKNSFKLN